MERPILQDYFSPVGDGNEIRGLVERRDQHPLFVLEFGFWSWSRWRSCDEPRSGIAGVYPPDADATHEAEHPTPALSGVF